MISQSIEGGGSHVGCYPPSTTPTGKTLVIWISAAFPPDQQVRRGDRRRVRLNGGS